MGPSFIASHPFPPQLPAVLQHISYVNAVYYPNYKVYQQRPPSSLNLEYVSHIFYAFAWPAADGTINLSDEWADLEVDVDGTQGCIGALRRLKEQHPRLRIILSIGGGSPEGSGHFARIASQTITREIFARNARELCQLHGFDGVDVDWEHPQNALEGADYVHLLANVRAILPSPYIITSALPAGPWALRHINLHIASEYLDFINVMCYDFSGPWTHTTGHQSQLFTPNNSNNPEAQTSGHSAVQYICTRGVPSHKLLMGIPAYGRSFLGAAGMSEPFYGTGGQDGIFEYRDLPRPNSREYVDQEVVAAFCIGGDGGIVSYDNAQTVQMKANYAKSARLGGLFYWTGTGDVTGARSLIEAGYNALHEL